MTVRERLVRLGKARCTLKPCPFCGSEVELRGGNTESGELAYHYNGEVVVWMWIECRKCSISGKVCQSICWKDDLILAKMPHLDVPLLVDGDKVNPAVNDAVRPIAIAAIVELWNQRHCLDDLPDPANLEGKRGK